MGRRKAMLRERVEAAAETAAICLEDSSQAAQPRRLGPTSRCGREPRSSPTRPPRGRMGATFP